MDTEKLTPEQIAELVRVARVDAALWAAIKAYELKLEERYAEAERHESSTYLSPPPVPALDTMAQELVERRYGKGANVSLGLLMFVLRRTAREELGLSTDLSFGLEIADAEDGGKTAKRRPGKAPKRSGANKKRGGRKPRAKAPTQE
jgi:hypothetical protein